MHTLAAGVGFLDLEFRGRPEVIATAVMHGPAGVVLVDPGPSSCLDTLEAGLARHGMAVADVRQILLTHIHLDHAGATGCLVRENPEITVWVHERGAPHVVDPSRLLRSASRLYGDAMQELWGDVLPVPDERVRPLAGGERIELGDRRVDVAYTPGHASHHVGFLDASAGIAYVGDTAGIRTPDSPFVLPPTPPPDIDLEAWRDSLRRIQAWGANTLFLTHFGPTGGVDAHLAMVDEQLEVISRLARRALEAGESEEIQFERFAKDYGLHLRRHLPEEEAATYERAAPLFYNWLGLSRYWRKRTQSGS